MISYQGNYQEDILKMNDAQLREKVEDLEIQLNKLKRYLNATLENLDDSNFATHIVKEKENMKGKITVTADKLESVYEKTEENSIKSSTFLQTAEQIKTTVEEMNDPDEAGSLAYKVSQVQQTADGLNTTVATYSEKVDELDTNLANNYYTKTETAKEVSGQIGTNFDNGLKLEATVGNGPPTSSTDKTKVYYDKSGKRYYYCNHASPRVWVDITNTKSLYSSYVFDDDGFKLNGNMIVDGSITAEQLSADTIQTNRIKSKKEASNRWLGLTTEITSTDTYDGFGFYNNITASEGASFEDALFGISVRSTSEPGVAQGGVNMYMNGQNILGEALVQVGGHSTKYHTVFPKGRWDFSSCDYINLGLRFT